MAAHPSIDPAGFLHEHLAQASSDLLRSLLTTMIDTLMSAEADAICGADYGRTDPGRVNQRNGYRHRDFDTRAGTLDVAIPKLRSVGSRVGAGQVSAAVVTGPIDAAESGRVGLEFVSISAIIWTHEPPQRSTGSTINRAARDGLGSRRHGGPRPGRWIV